MSKYEFDARRYCQNNRDRMGHRPDGTPVADLIICEIDSRNVRVEALRAELAALKAAARKVLAADGKDQWDAREYMLGRDELARLCGEG